MSLSGDSRVSVVLRAAQSGDRQAATELLPLVYTELHQLCAVADGSAAPRPDPHAHCAGSRGLSADRRRK
jgi:hypothetical protein